MTSISAVFPEFPATISNAIISEAKDFLRIFYCISEMCMKYRAFPKTNMRILA